MVRRDRRPHVAGRADDVRPGEQRIVQINGRSVGVFNVAGRYYALHNRCPHTGGALCEGPVLGTTLSTDEFRFVYGREGEIVRCGWHGWEFEIATGQALADPKIRARTFPVTVENGDIVVHI
ncbi:MAG: Rieske (2Fe-2S) protein [Anaerolineales bacterium]